MGGKKDEEGEWEGGEESRKQGTRTEPTWPSLQHLVQDPFSCSGLMSLEKWSIGSGRERWKLSA